MQTLIDKAAVLVEALPYIRRFRDSTFVIKYGGHAMVDDELRAQVAVDLVLLKYIGVRPVVVHGGGPQIGATLERLGKASSYVEGLRVTDDETMEVVEMVLGGKINPDIVQLVNRGGGSGVGLSGRDAGMLRVRRKRVGGQDIGRVGEVVAVDPGPVLAAAAAGYIPIIAPVGVDDDGVSYNVNADEAAGAIAAALGAAKLLMLTDVEGVKDADRKLLRQLSADDARKLIAEGTVSEGMIPKVECCIRAAEAGVERVHIVDGRIRHAILLEIFTDGGVGTLIAR
ncbi:MAG: acetylglutamate kinase [Deltaproteobacteria bacterium]|nr:acetylglutamate kinase [Deltaproteobacteria bacterium]MBW2372440.1 acetylglutamate kinase [Deltaproteobacteria bacterium]